MAVPRSVLSLFSKNSSSSLICKTQISVNLCLYYSTSAQKEQSFTVYELLKNKHNFSQQTASHVASVLTNLRDTQNFNSVLKFLKGNGFSITQLEKIMRKRPQYLTGKLEVTMKPKIATLQNMGFSANEIAEIITNNPVILCRSLKNKIIPNISVLKGLFGLRSEMVKVLRKPSLVLGVDFEKNFLPNIKLLKSCGVAMEQITSQINSIPNFFLINREVMRKSVDKADELGVDRSSRMFLHAVRAVSSMSSDNLELKLNTFRDLGFSEDDILRAFRNAPLVFAVSNEKIRKVKEVLLGTEKYDMSCIVKNPASLMYSVETRYKPRLQVLEVLEKKNLIEKWPKLTTLGALSNKDFCKRFVDPFPDELGDVKLMTVLKSK